MKKFKRLTSIITSICILMSTAVPYAMAEETQAIEEIHVTSGNNNNCIVIQSQTSTDFNIYRKGTDGTLTLVDLPNAKDNGGNTTSDNKWQYCNRRLYLDENLENGTKYTYVVKALDTDGNEIGEGAEISGTPFATAMNQTKFQISKYWNYWNASNYSYGYAEKKDGIGVDESAGLYVTKLAENDANNGYMSLTYNFGKTLESGKVYKFVWQEKVTKCNWSTNDGYRVQGGQSSVDGAAWGDTFVPFASGQNNGQWNTRAMYVKGVGQSSLEYYILKCTSDMVLDNFELYEVDATTLEAVSNENIIDGCDADFETVDPDNSSAVTAYFADEGVSVDGSLTEADWHLAKDFMFYGSSIGKLAALWDGEYMYLALSTANAEKLTVTLGDITTTYNVAENTFIPSVTGAKAISTDSAVIELALPLAECGITANAASQTVNFGAELEAGGKTAKLKASEITMLYMSLIYDENMDNLASTGFAQGTTWANTGSSANDVIIKQSQNTPGAVNLYNLASSTEVCKGWRKAFAEDMSGAFDLEFTIGFNNLPVLNATSMAWHGFCFEMYNDKRYRFSFSADENDNVLMNVLYYKSGDGSGTTVTQDTGLQIGDTATIRFSVAQDKAVTVYANGKQILTFAKLTLGGNSNRTIEWVVYQRFATSGLVDVDLYDMAISKPVSLTDEVIAESIENSLTFDDIKGDNEAASLVVSDLVLPQSIKALGLYEYDLVWTSSKTDIVDNTGKIVGGSQDGDTVTLTATATVGEVTVTKTFDLTVYLSSANAYLYLGNDINPYSGKMISTYVPSVFSLDQNYNSVGYDLGTVQKVNHVILTDNNGSHRINKIDLSLYVSDDNVTYRRVKNFDMSSVGSNIYLYNFDESARYVKVHCHYETSQYYDIANGEYFSNNLNKIIFAEYNDEFIGNGGGAFVKTGECYIKSREAGNDLVAYITYEEIEACGADCEADYRDLRLVLEGRMLPYWLDDEGIYVRVPETEANKVIVVDIYGGNANAVSISDIDSVFEVTYGNKTIMELSVPDTEFDDAMRVTTAPNGDLIAIAYKRPSQMFMTMRRSTDGGRTWGEVETIRSSTTTMDGGGFIVDNGKIWYIFDHKELGYPELAIITSEDNGYNWSEAVTLSTGTNYSLTYFDGVKTASYDGEGDGIDYVFTFSYAQDLVNMGDFAISTVYSTDNGKSWKRSQDSIAVTWDDDHSCEEKLTESGMSENSIVVLSNGDILLYARCEYDENPGYFATAVSKDNGLTWEEWTLSNVNTTNTLPAFKELGNDIMLLWGGHSDVSPRKQQRYPLALAYSSDDGQTWQQKMDLWAGTSRANYICHGTNPQIIRAVQSSITVGNAYGENDAFISYHEEWDHNTGMLIEDIDDFLHKTKGAADDFENVSTSLDEGWLDYRGNASVTDEKAKNGKYSMKIDDVSGMISRFSRSIPQMMNGEVSFDFNLETMTTGFNVELKSTFNYETYQSTIAMAHINKDGYVFVTDPEAKGVSGSSLAQISVNEWHNLKIVFDVEADTAELYLDNKLLGDMPVNTATTAGGACFIQLTDGSTNANPGMTAYIDNFVAYEGVSFENFKETNTLSISETSVSANVITQSAVFIIASYQGEQLLGVEVFNIAKDTTVALSETILDLTGGNVIRAYLWKDMECIEPLCESVEVTIPKVITYGENLIKNSDFTDENGAGTMEGWSLYSNNAAAMTSGMSMELTEATVNGVTKPVLKWNYLIGSQGHIRYLDYNIGTLEAGDYLISVTVAVPGNPGADSFGITRDSNGDMAVNNGYEIGRFSSEYKTFTKTVTITEELESVEQSFRISSNGYGDTGSMYISEASVRKINN